jgi:hypothetical protein
MRHTHLCPQTHDRIFNRRFQFNHQKLRSSRQRAMWGQKEESKNPFGGLMPQKKSSASNLVQNVKVTLSYRFLVSTLISCAE